MIILNGLLMVLTPDDDPHFEYGKQVAFLNAAPLISDKGIKMDLYTKPTNTASYLDPTSFHHPKTFNGVIASIFDTIRRITDDEFLCNRLEEGFINLLHRKYSLMEVWRFGGL